ncbi:MAG: hypothetical protein U1F36_22385 [Planctomycetota bacterium]
MAGRAGRALALITALCAAQALPCQSARLQIHLRADGEHRGPAAWVWARENLARSLSPQLADPLAALLVTIDESSRITIVVDPAPVTESYLRFVLTCTDGSRIEGECDGNGHERWSVPAGFDRDALPPALLPLCTRFGYEARTGWLSLDLCTAVGDLMAGAAEGDPTSSALTLGAAECGTVAVLARSDAKGALSVEGQSDGGLLLPALLIALADRQSGRASRNAGTHLADDLDRWLLLAMSAEHEEQEEAARQLGRFQDPRAVHALERLLRGEGMVRLIAMHGLVRLHSVRSLGAIVAAADPKQEGSVSLAAGAVWSLAPDPVARELVRSLPDGGTSATTPHAARGYSVLDLLLTGCSVLTLLSVIALVALERRQALRPWPA